MAGLPVETTAPPGGSYEELRKNLTRSRSAERGRPEESCALASMKETQ